MHQFRGMKDAIIFTLVLLSAACAENIPLLMAVVVAAAGVMVICGRGRYQ